MKRRPVRITLDIPAPVYRKLKVRAAAEGQTVREFILSGLRTDLAEGGRGRTRRLKFPLINSDGPKVDLTNERIYGSASFP